MAHTCPDCGMLCHCGGDIDDCEFDGTPEQDRCGHCADAEDRESEDAEVHCPNCDHRLDEPINDIWKDPHVEIALKEGRSACDIAVLACPKCGRWGYYNQGSHFWCRFCNQGWFCCTESETPPPDTPYMWIDGLTSLADTVTVTTDGYDNETLPGANAQRKDT